MWDKWAQNTNNTQMNLVRAENEFYVFLASPGIEVTHFILPNEDVTWLPWMCAEENITTVKNVNVAIAAHVPGELA
jgi:hypothetical protein